MCRQTSSTQLGKPLHQIKLHGGHLTFATVWLQLRWPLEVPPTPQGHCWQLELRDTQVSSKPWQHPPQQDSLVADPHRHHLGSGQWRHWHGNPGWADFENLVRHQYHVFINIYIYICDGKAPVTGWPPPNPVKESDMSMVMSSWSVVERPSTDSVNLKRDLSLSTLFAAEGLDSLYTSETWS